MFFAVVLGLLGVGLYFSVRTTMLREAGEQLEINANLIERDFDLSNSTIDQFSNTPDALMRPVFSASNTFDGPTLYVQIATVDGTIISRSPSLGNANLPLDQATIANLRAGTDEQHVVALGDGRVLLLCQPLMDDGEMVGILQVAHPLNATYRALELLLISLAVSGIVALLAAIRGGAWLAQRALEPVMQIAHTADGIVHAEDLAQRVPQAPANDEIGDLTRTINDMLSRLEGLFTAQRRFVADVSHELRTPLTAMRGNLEVLRRGAIDDPAALRDSLGAIEREVDRLARMTSDLLVLAQAEGGAPMRRAAVALDELVLEVVRDMQPLARGLTLAPSISEQVAVTGDPDRIKQALINLVANAIQHTPAGGSVTVALSRTDQQAVLCVRDTGSGIAPTDLPHVFERFYRADKARSRQAGGAGLGLAIVQWVAEAHNGSVSVESTPAQGSAFTIRLPL